MWKKRKSLAANDKDFSLCSKWQCERATSHQSLVPSPQLPATRGS